MIFWNINPACRGIFYMSNIAELDLNLENLFQPAWAQGKTEANRFEKFTGNEGVKPERISAASPANAAPRAATVPAVAVNVAAALAVRRGGGGSKFGGGDRKGGFRGGDRRDDRREERPAPPAPLPELNVAFIPEERGRGAACRGRSR